MEPFLKNTANHLLKIIAEENIPPDAMCVVLPTRRSSLFLKKFLSANIDQPVWSPGIYSIDDFVFKHAPFEVAEECKLIRYLYASYVKNLKAEPFSEFYPWGRIMLKDFDEIDRNLTDHVSLFNTLKEIREIEDWDPGESSTEVYEQFLKANALRSSQKKADQQFFWKKLLRIFNDFKEQLRKNEIGYAGMAYRYLAEQLREDSAILPYKKVVFAGFNALSESEMVIFKMLQDNGHAETLWDSDPYYLENIHLEAGRFLRENRKSFGRQGIFGTTENFAEHKNIEIVGAPGAPSVMKVLGSELDKLCKKGKKDWLDTVVVLPDANDAVPLMYFLPEEIEKVNFTMGLSFDQTQLAGLLNITEDLYGNIVQHDKDRLVYYRDLINYISHPLISPFFPDATSFIKEIREKNLLHIPVSHLISRYQDAEADFLIRFPDNTGKSLKNLEQLLNLLNSDDAQVTSIEKAVAGRFLSVLDEIAEIVNDRLINPENVTAFWRLVKEVVHGLRIPFSGQPLQGLQVMGLIETMTLDFKNVFLLGCNESTLPGESNAVSLIPFDLRNAFGLPLPDTQASIYAYHFYRLIQRAENITLLYDTEPSKKSNEKSRFVRQLELELPAYNSQAAINEQTYHLPPDNASVVPETGVMTEPLQKKLKDIFESKGVSPSQIITRALCPLKYFYSRLLDIKEPESVDEDPDAGKTGTIFHETLAALYGPVIGKELDEKDIDQMIKQSADALKVEFEKEKISLSGKASGKSVLSYETLLILIRNTLEHDRKQLPFKVVAIEKKLKCKLKLRDDLTVLYKGVTDRVDYDANKGIYRLVDYKTGSIGNLKLKTDDTVTITKHNKEAFQLMFYAWLWQKSSDNTTSPVQAAVVSLREQEPCFQYLKTESGSEPEYSLRNEDFQWFEEFLKRFSIEMYDATSFPPTSDIDLCRTCAYKNLCMR